MFVMLACISKQVYADGDARGPKNGVESQRSGLCGTQPGINVFGAVWINDVWPLDSSDARWSESVTVGATDTSVDAWMWTTAYNCPSGIPRSNIQIFNLGSPPAPASPISISFPYGDTIDRGSGVTYPGQFTDPPSALKVKLDISNQQSGCYDVAYNGTYREGGAVGYSNTYFTKVCINRLPPPDIPPTGNLDAVDCDLASGWAKDPNWPAVQPNDPNAPNKLKTLRVKIYKDNWPENGGTYVAEGQADVWRPDVGVHGFNINISSAKSWTKNKFYAVAEGFDDNGNYQGYFHIGGEGKESGPCQKPVCGNFSPLGVEPGEPFPISAGFSISGSAPPGGLGYTVNISIPGIFTGSFPGTIPFGGSPVVSINVPGTYSNSTLGLHNGSYTIKITGVQDLTCPGPITVSAKPFFSVREGDISSGFTGTCEVGSGWKATTASNPSLLIGWNKWPSSVNEGAGTNLAVMALSTIDGVTSKQPVVNNPAPLALTFANEGVNSSNYGGNYQGSLDCPKNYYKQHNGLPNTLTSSINLPLPASDMQYTAGTGTFTLNGGSLGAGKRSALYVKGDVYINGDITLGNPAGTPLNNLANFYLVTTGNIYISPEVKNLEGVYIAQGSGTTSGNIYTCGQSNFKPPTVAMMTSDQNGGCRENKLLVKGAFIADKIHFYRSSGTLYKNEPAETVVYTPATWLALPTSIKPLFKGGDGTTTGAGYDSITTLQPVL